MHSLAILHSLFWNLIFDFNSCACFLLYLNKNVVDYCCCRINISLFMSLFLNLHFLYWLCSCPCVRIYNSSCSLLLLCCSFWSKFIFVLIDVPNNLLITYHFDLIDSFNKSDCEYNKILLKKKKQSQRNL